MESTEFEVYLLYWFIVIWIPISIFTKYRLNVITVFLEDIQIMYALFALLPSIGNDFRIYFESYVFMTFGVRDFIYGFQRAILFNFNHVSLEDYSKLIYAFPEVIFVLITFIILAILRNKWILIILKIYIIKFIMISTFLKLQFLYLTIFFNILKLLEAESLSLLDAISIIFCILFLLVMVWWVYCWVIHKQIKWYFCTNFVIFEEVKLLSIISDPKQKNYIKFTIVNQARKLVIWVLLIIGVKGFFVYVYIGNIYTNKIDKMLLLLY